jgi:DNA-binding response OmpR family regulator
VQRLEGEAVKRILAVDDEPHILKLVAFSLKSGGYEVLEATDGLSAISVVQAEQPDLVLMDVMMPTLDGYEACRRLKADPATADIPVIMLTAKTQSTEHKTGYDVGAADYITKPFTPKDLVAHVRELLGE